jgi:putative ABC transport system permease protein
VVGFFQFAGKSGGFVAYTDYDYLAKITHIPNKSSLFRVVAANGPLTLDQQKALGRRVEAVLDAKGYHVSEISSGLDIIATTSEGLDTLTNVLLIMAILTALVGSIGLAGTMSMNVLERTREIGILRAIGASDGTIMKMVLVEGLVIGGISWILGSLLAIPISRVMSDAVCQVLFNTNSTFSFNFTGFGIWLVLVIILSLLASLIPARNAARMTIREVLAYE